MAAGKNRSAHPSKSHILLSRMEAVRHETRHHLDLVRRQIEGRTERIAIAQKANNRSHKRAGSFWPRSDLEFQSHLQRLELERRGENKARAHKLNFQDRAIAAHLAKLGAPLREHAV